MTQDEKSESPGSLMPAGRPALTGLKGAGSPRNSGIAAVM